MSAYDPPTEDIGVFNSSLFLSTSENTITQSYADTHYLKYPTAQTATETINSLVATTLLATNDATINGLTVGKGGGSVSTNTAMGVSSLLSTTGDNNTAIGYVALTANSSGDNNTAIGGQVLSANTTGSDNTGIGYLALDLNNSGLKNTAIGTSTLSSNTTGSNNTALGYQAGTAGTDNITGSNNTYIGYQAQANASNYSSSTALGAGAIITASNRVVLGTSSQIVQVPNQLGFSYSSYPSYTSSQSFGYSLTTTISTAVVMASTNVVYNIDSFTLPIGGWLITIKGEIAQNSSSINFMRVGISATSATFNDDYRTIVYCNNAYTDPIFNTMFYFPNSTSRTIYFVASPQGSSFQIKVGAEMVAIRLH